MRKWLLAIALLLSFCYIMFLAYGCSLYVSIEGKKQPAAVIQPAATPTVTASKPKPKTRYEILKEEHNREWLNLPHRESEHELFQPK